VKSARAMKRAVAYLLPYMEAAKKASGETMKPAGKVLLATVKGDVHDIGKNIVGVVLGCNNYEVIDLGVMVSADAILDAAVREEVDLIGLSGLITPSLDEMVFVAREMKRRGMTLPLAIGGATTSKAHTAVKIAPVYDSPVVHVLDASRAVDAVSNLINPATRPAYDVANRDLQEKLRVQHGALKRRPLVPYREVCAHAVHLPWSQATLPGASLPTPAFTGARVIDVPIEELIPYIDWTFFFAAWDLKGTFPAILTHPQYGPAAVELYEQARVLLDRIVTRKALTAKGVYGFWPAQSDGGDIVLYDPSAGRLDPDTELVRFSMLRQQEQLGEGQPYRSLADFIAPRESGLTDVVGAFAVTSGLGADALAAEYMAANDDYSAIIVKALADRLAEAFAEYLHARARRDLGYGADEHLSNEDLIEERYRGIRPAFGYPACPDHSEKKKLFALLDPARIGITLTENFAMLPAAAVSGLYLAHPDAKYFTVGRIGKDQVEDYALRKGIPVSEVERWLTPNLGYEPAGV